MNYKDRDDMTILFFAFRYSLPPSTIGRSGVLEQIIEDRKQIDKTWRSKMAEEARDSIKFVKDIRKGEELSYSTKHDIEVMENFIKVMESEDGR